ncbi:unnamed protein product, partial [marine sediment metagenome]
LKSIPANIALGTFTGTLLDVVVNKVYYWQWQGTPVALKSVIRSGIYTYLHKAP